MSGEYRNQEEDNLILNDGESRKRWRLSDTACVKKHPWIPCCCCGFLGLILLVLSAQLLFLPQLLDDILRSGIKKSLIFTYPKPKSSSYRSWVSDTGKNYVPIWMEMRFYNVTNGDDVLTNGSYPQLVLSPLIAYNEWQNKLNVSFSDDGQWATFYSWTYYTLNEEKSKISKNDYFVIFSPFVAAMYHLREADLLIDYLIEKLGISATILHEIGEDIIEDIIWDQIFKHINDHPELLFLKGTAESILFDLYTVEIPLHTKWFNHTFIWALPGLLGNQSISSNLANETLHTGHGDESRLGEILMYEGLEWVPCWNPALVLSPGHDDYYGLWTIKKGDNLLAWVSNLKVNLVVEYNGTQNYYGVELYRYTVQTDPQLLNATEYPPNAIYNAYGPSGILNLTSCSDDIPLYVSLPGFLGGPAYEANNSLMGLSNLSWADQPYLSVEPITGAIMNANKSLQLNTKIMPIPESWLKGTTSETNRRRRMNSVVSVEVTENARLKTNSSTNTTNTTSTTTAAPAPATNTTTATPTSSPTVSPTAAPTTPQKSLANLPYLTVPIMETSECEGLTESQAHDFKSEIYGTQDLIEALKIVGYVATPLLVIYTWWVCYWLGKRRARIKNF